MLYSYDGANQPDYDGADDGGPDYQPAGTPDAVLLARWVVDALADHPDTLLALHNASTRAFEQAPEGSAEEATMDLLSQLLDDAMAGPL